LKPSEPVREIPGAPHAHGMPITVHLACDSEIRRVIGRGYPQDQATSEREGLRGGVRTRKQLQLGPVLVR
jgi:hypothetical protein